MEVIDKMHDEISIGHDRQGLAAYISFNNEKYIYISAGACKRFRITAGLKINFINDENDWLFYCDNGDDGFDLIERKDKNAVIIMNAALIRLFLKRTRCRLPCKFPVSIVTAKLDGHQIIKIEINKPY